MIASDKEITEITLNVCQTMLGLELKRDDALPMETEKPWYSSSVCISGDAKFTIEVVACQDAADFIARAMFGIEESTPSLEETSDALGEIANMIGGNYKGILGGESQLSIPCFETKDSGLNFDFADHETVNFMLETGYLVVSCRAN